MGPLQFLFRLLRKDTTMETPETPTGVAPSADTPAQDRRKVVAGRGAEMLIGSIAFGAFILHAIIMLYGIFYSQ